MKKIIKTIRLILTPVLIVLGVFAFLAGTDIYHGTEPDLSSEWNIFSTFFYLSYFYILLSALDLFIKNKES